MRSLSADALLFRITIMATSLHACVPDAGPDGYERMLLPMAPSLPLRLGPGNRRLRIGGCGAARLG